MSNPTGFLEFQRREVKNKVPKERIKNHDEFCIQHSGEILNEQAQRCMNCGVPFCHSGAETDEGVIGCPLNNLIPEWNEFLGQGDISQAYEREILTNSFPEITGRVCPALCEYACNASLYSCAVTIKNIEKYIAETMFEKNLVIPRIPKERTGEKIAVIGSGPAGLTCADFLNRLGHTVTVFERDDRIGGLLMYGIPNMKLDKRIVKRRTDLMEAEGIEFVTSVDVAKDITVLDKFNAVAVCTGATKPRRIEIDGSELNGVYYAMEILKSNTKSMLDSDFKDKRYIDLKGKNVVILGGGDTASDCVATAIRHGCKSIVQLEIMPEQNDDTKKQWPVYRRNKSDDYAQDEAEYVFGKRIKQYSKLVKRLEGEDGNIKKVHIKDVKWEGRNFFEIDGSERVIDCDVFIIAIGFTGPETELIDALGLVKDEKQNIAVNKETHMTNKEGIFAGGDCCKGQSLVVWAARQGRDVAFAIDKYLRGENLS